MKFFKGFFLIAFSLILNSCGGVIGNIEQYDYPMPTKDLKKYVDIVLAKNPDSLLGVNSGIYTRTDTTLRGIGQKLIINADKKYILRFKLLDYSDFHNPDSISTISLNSGAEYGEILQLASNINYFKKKKYQKLFEEHFISKLNLEIKKDH